LWRADANWKIRLIFRNYWYWDYLKVVHIGITWRWFIPALLLIQINFLHSQHKIYIQQELKGYMFRHVVVIEGTRSEYWIVISKLPEENAKRLPIITARGAPMLIYVLSRGQPTVVAFHLGGWTRNWQLLTLKFVRNATEGQQRAPVEAAIYRSPDKIKEMFWPAEKY
jgi:hypothetical protein